MRGSISKLATVICLASVLSACHHSQEGSLVKPVLPTVPAHLMTPAKNQWLLSSPTVPPMPPK
jgi:hypothetical protein